MTNCKECTHFGVCVVRTKIENQTIEKFPDGKVAVVESVVISCDHHVSNERDSRDQGDTDYQELRRELRAPAPSYEDPGPAAPDMRGMVPQSMDSEVIEFGGPGVPPARREVTYAMPEMRTPTLPPGEPARQGGPIRLKLGGANLRR